jgi:hypothetical protein
LVEESVDFSVKENMLSFLDNIFKPIGKGLSEADTFMNREMPFNMSWGFPAALVASYFAPQLIGMGGSGGTAFGGSAGSGTSYGGLLESMGLSGGGQFTGVPGQESIFELSASQMTPEYLNLLASQQGVSQGEPGFFQRMLGNTEQGLYDQLGSGGQSNLMKMAQQSNQRAQQEIDAMNRIQPAQGINIPRAGMKRGEAVNVAEGLLNLLAANQPKTRVPRISLI